MTKKERSNVRNGEVRCATPNVCDGESRAASGQVEPRRVDMLGLDTSVTERGSASYEILLVQLRRFRDKFGRDPRPEEPVFFDPDADVPRPLQASLLSNDVVRSARAAGVTEADIYAMKKTGLVIIKGVNEHLFTTEDKLMWLAAIEEFKSLN